MFDYWLLEMGKLTTLHCSALSCVSSAAITSTTPAVNTDVKAQPVIEQKQEPVKEEQKPVEEPKKAVEQAKSEPQQNNVKTDVKVEVPVVAEPKKEEPAKSNDSNHGKGAAKKADYSGKASYYL